MAVRRFSILLNTVERIHRNLLGGTSARINGWRHSQFYLVDGGPHDSWAVFSETRQKSDIETATLERNAGAGGLGVGESHFIEPLLNAFICKVRLDCGVGALFARSTAIPQGELITGRQLGAHGDRPVLRLSKA